MSCSRSRRQVAGTFRRQVLITERLTKCKVQPWGWDTVGSETGMFLPPQAEQVSLFWTQTLPPLGSSVGPSERAPAVSRRPSYMG